MKAFKLIVFVISLLLSSYVCVAQTPDTNDNFCEIGILDGADGLSLGYLEAPAYDISAAINSKIPYIIVGEKQLKIKRNKLPGSTTGSINIISQAQIICKDAKFEGHKNNRYFDNYEYIDNNYSDPQEIKLSVSNERHLSFIIAHECPKFESIDSVKLEAYRRGESKKPGLIKIDNFSPGKSLDLMVHDSIAKITVYGGKNAKFESLTFNEITFTPKRAKKFLDTGEIVYEVKTKIQDATNIKCDLICSILDNRGQNLTPKTIFLFTIKPKQIENGSWKTIATIISVAVLLLLGLFVWLWLRYRRCKKGIREIDQQLEPIKNNLVNYSEEQQQTINEKICQIESIKTPKALKAFFLGFNLKKKKGLLEELIKKIQDFELGNFKNKLNVIRAEIDSSPCGQTIKNYLRGLTYKVENKLEQRDNNSEINNVFSELEEAKPLLKEQAAIIPKQHEDILVFLNKLLIEGVNYHEPNGEIRNKIQTLKLLWENNGKERGKAELIEDFKKTDIYRKYHVSNSLNDLNFEIYLSNLVEIAKNEAIASISDNPEIQILQNTIYNLNEKLSAKETELTEAIKAKENALALKKEAEDSRNKISYEKIVAEEAKKDVENKLNEKKGELDSALQQIEDLKNQHPTFESLSEEEKQQIKEQAAEAVKNDYEHQISVINDSKEQAIADAVNTAVANVRAEAEQEKNAWNAEKSRLNADLMKEKEGRANDLIKAEREKTEAVNQAISSTKSEQESIREQAVAAVTERLTSEVTSLREQLRHEQEEHLATQIKAEERLAEAQRHERAALEDANTEFDEKFNKAIQEKDETLRKESDKVNDLRKKIHYERESVAANMQNYIKRLYQASKKAFENARDNYKQEGDRIVNGIEDLYAWFHDNIVAQFQMKEDFTQEEIISLMQGKLIELCQNKYSFAVELMRMTAYRNISKDWNNWFIQQGVSVDEMLRAYDELVGLMGLCNITALVPSLYVDTYSANKYENNVVDTNIENYVPEGFDHRQKTNTVRDMVLPGLYVNGEIHSNPVVWA
jgi:hypothetical protein